MGVQSLDENLLDRLGRIHSRATVFKSFDILRRAGFDNLNLDLMFAIPGQTMEIWRDTLNEAVACGANICPPMRSSTRTTRRCLSNCRPVNLPWTRIWPARCMSNWSTTRTNAGFQQYEMANFARDVRLPMTPVSRVHCQPSRPETRTELQYPAAGLQA